MKLHLNISGQIGCIHMYVCNLTKKYSKLINRVFNSMTNTSSAKMKRKGFPNESPEWQAATEKKVRLVDCHIRKSSLRVAKLSAKLCPNKLWALRVRVEFADRTPCANKWNVDNQSNQLHVFASVSVCSIKSDSIEAWVLNSILEVLHSTANFVCSHVFND